MRLMPFHTTASLKLINKPSRIGRTQVAQQLSFVRGMNALDGLELEDDPIIDDQVGDEFADDLALVVRREADLPPKRNVAIRELFGECTFVVRLQLPRPEVAVHLDHAPTLEQYLDRSGLSTALRACTRLRTPFAHP